jgi:hypothetical protein
MESINKRSFKLHYRPFNFDKGMHAIEKEEDGIKRRYLQGISSGQLEDGDGERITKEAIDDFMVQAEAGDIPLYAGKHDIDFIDDVGILTKAQLIDGGLNWFTQYRLYDEHDNMGPVTLEKADKLWARNKGLPPYKKPKKLGFSIEGYIPDDGIESITQKDGRVARVIRKVNLEGVVVVPNPSYKDSIATGLYKALGEVPPWHTDRFKKQLRETLSERIRTEDVKRDYSEAKWRIMDAFDQGIHDIMRDPQDPERQDKIVLLFNEYRDIMIPILMQSQEVFIEEVAGEDIAVKSLAERRFGKIMKEAGHEIGLLINSIERRVKC